MKIRSFAATQRERVKTMKTRPKVVVERDYDGYFERLTNSWLDRAIELGHDFKYHTIVITSGPYRSSVVTVNALPSNPGEVNLDFYAASRVGFGSLSEQDVLGIIELL
jgi:hypothetical protein